ncbi:hypothetical protein O6H91_03G069200 [Diphasiastrum complanatum]|uniref:Uncharacterized protein n=1 Tax=Diphasiastrum complanatum TaxID=34168 RepID=A0ACC2E7F3_DIPCM|nr:hypothetical protein O6H91_03G069200 [Diphasiastrum complanatum]
MKLHHVSSSKLKENEVKEPTIHVSELDLNIDLTNMVQNAFETIDKVLLECENHIGEDSCNINADSEYGNQATSDKAEGNEDVDAIKFSSLMEDAKKPLFEGCKEVDNKLFELAQGPLQVARSYSVMNIKGYHFRTEKADIGKVTQDSGVAAYFDTWSHSSVKDKNPIMATPRYFGRIIHILELDWDKFRQCYCIVNGTNQTILEAMQ